MSLKNYSNFFVFFIYSIATIFLFIFGIFTIDISLNTLHTPVASAQSVDDLNKQIENFNKQIEQIEREIAEQRRLIETTSSRAGEIQAKINSLNATKNKLQNEISQTQHVIKRSEATINKIDLEITDKEQRIQTSEEGLSESLRRLNILNDVSLVEIIIDASSISEFLQQIAEVNVFKEVLIDKKYELLDLNRELSHQKTEEELEKERLEKEQQILLGQQETIIDTQKAEANLLAVTRSEQAKYEQLLAEKEAQKKQFETLLFDIESQIKRLIDPDSYPSGQRGVLAWPLSSIRLTQEFGGSQFAATNPHIYGRPFHPGTDFGVPIGTKVMSVSDGIVKGSGNTDAFPGCYAWGKWILIEHDNGLSTLYAHLSSIIVSNGQRVTSGEVIALSGNTGYSTGPHLHLTLYVSQGVQIGKYGTYKPGGSGCAATDATGPFSDLDAYLDPMEYLPAL